MFEANYQVSLYYIGLLIIVLCASLSLALLPYERLQTNKTYNIVRVLALGIFVVAFIGWREWWVEDVFVDSIRYGESFLTLSWDKISTPKDIGFDLFSILLRKMNIGVNSYFICCSLLYVIPIIKAARRIDKKHQYLIFLFCVVSFSFYNYGVNGIRNGISTSFLLLGLTYTRFSTKQLIYFTLATLFHISSLLVILGYILSYCIKKEKTYYLVWIFSIVIGYFLYDFIVGQLTNYNILPQRINYYFSGTIDSSKFSIVGMRFDFITYSSLPIVCFLFINSKKQKIDSLYTRLLKSYMLINALWIVVNKMPYSNRIAYLSWFLMPILLVVPLLHLPIIKRCRYLVLALVLICYYLFTYFKNV